MRYCLLPVLLACFVASVVHAQAPKKPGEALELKLIAKKDAALWDAGGKTPKEFKQLLDDLAAELKKKPFAGPKLPAPPAVDLVLQIVNTGKEEAAIWVGGDPNEVTLELKGPGVMALKPAGVFTLELRPAKKVVLAAGKHHEIPLSKLTDGFRSAARSLYWTEPGEYTLTAQYRL